MAVKSKPRPPNYPLVLVEWVDSSRSDGWRFFDEKSFRPHPVFSVGWLLQSDDAVVVVVPHASMTEGDAFDQMIGDITIPRAAVRRIRTLSRRRL